MTITGTDLDTNGSALTAAITSALPAGLNLTLTPNNTTVGGPFPGGPDGARTWTLTGTADVAPGTYTLQDGTGTALPIEVVVG